ncbi:malate synthase [Tessaracoccus sp. MC1756]|uniref:malate synthase n=1 Tax=Tessaracoccus sp. MC1756 TaxID=2760311 RepID=UPI0015FF4A03|nr:malate synthase [Tessaracoccus sp. MC1756]MBB1509588.1 malate synthase A [Tessaracoccus sp. MC1756]
MFTNPPQTHRLQATTPSAGYHLSVVGDPVPGDETLLTPDALEFIRALHRRFSKRRLALLDARFRRTTNRDTLGFLPETSEIRSDDWTVPVPAPGLERRVVELSGPVDAASCIEALNSDADVWIADFEDSTSPTWANIITGHLNLKATAAGGLPGIRAEGGPTVVLRPRGWHLLERHIKVDSEPVPASLVDFALHCFHNAAPLLEQGRGPYFYLPKLETHLEARLWNDVFDFAEASLGLPVNCIRATVLIETITAAFEMDEILFELRGHAAGLAAGRWDYIFSIIKQLGGDASFQLPDRRDITFDADHLQAFFDLLVHTAHRRGGHALGGLTATTTDEVDSSEQVRAAKESDARRGFDGSWVAQVDLISTCSEAYAGVLAGRPHQLEAKLDDPGITTARLLTLEEPGPVTDDGIAANMAVLVRFLDAWLDGRGEIAVDGLLQETSTTEIARAQLWQWSRTGVTRDDGRPVTRHVLVDALDRELEALRADDDSRHESRLAAIRHLVEFGALGEVLPPSVTEHAYRRYLLDA